MTDTGLSGTGLSGTGLSGTGLTGTGTGGPARTDEARLADQAVALVRRWVAEAAQHEADPSAEQLAGVLRDPRGLAFTVGFVDGVVRPEDAAVAARALAALAKDVPAFLPPGLRALVRLGGLAAPIAPQVVVPAARAVLRRMVSHLVLDARDRQLGAAIERLRGDGVRLNINLLGEAVLGQGEAARRLAGTHRLLARADVDYVSIKVSAAVAPHSPWAFDEAVDDVVEQLVPLYLRAAESTPSTFINLDMEEYKDLDLTLAVFRRLLDRQELLHLEAGIVLQAYLPDCLAAMVELQEWAAARRARGGAAIKVRLVKGANLPMERADACVHGWPLATWGSKEETDVSYKRVLDWALTPERVRSVRVGVAGHNLFDVAHAWLLAQQRGVADAVDVEMLLGMAPGQAEAVRRDVGRLLLYTPVVAPAEFDVAIAYLVRRLEEGASSENFMSAVFELDSDEAMFAREQARFRSSLAAAGAAAAGAAPPPHRVPDRFAAAPRPRPGRFANTPDTDPSVAQHRDWGRAVLERAGSAGAHRLGADAIAAARTTSAADLEAALSATARAGAAWGALPGAERARYLHAVGEALEAARADLLEVMAAEAGKTLDQGDPEVSEAVDFAHSCAELAAELDDVDGATAVPVRLTLVTPPWNFPVAIPAGSTLAALAAGSAVVLKPAGPAERCGAVLAEVITAALQAAGADPGVLRLLQVDEAGLGRELVASPLVDRVVLTGAYETAELFRSFRPDLPLLAETSGKNAIVVTPSADLDLAVRDVVASAFGHAGQKCSAASLVVLVGSVSRSRRFRTQLVDAAASLVVGPASAPTTQLGPLVEPATGKALAGLTELGPGERWLLEPRRLDVAGRQWTPGIRAGVRRGSPFARTEHFVPVLGIVEVATLQDAIGVVNDVDYGLTSGLHSLDAAEIVTWLADVQAGNLYVNRTTTGAIVRRQPFGGWKRSAVGPGTKAGGTDHLLPLTGWAPARSRATAPVTDPRVTALLTAAGVAPEKGALDADDVAQLHRAASSDAAAWAEHLGRAVDASGLWAERNVLRHLPVGVTVRLAEGGSVLDLLRVLLAAALAGGPVAVSTGVPLGGQLAGAVARLGGGFTTEDDARWLASASALGGGRVRLVTAPHGREELVRALADAVGGRPDLAVWAGPVTEAGRIELLPFLREQAVSITAHRFGTPSDLTAGLLPDAPVAAAPSAAQHRGGAGTP